MIGYFVLLQTCLNISARSQNVVLSISEPYQGQTANMLAYRSMVQTTTVGRWMLGFPAPHQRNTL